MGEWLGQTQGDDTCSGHERMTRLDLVNEWSVCGKKVWRGSGTTESMNLGNSME